VDLKDPEKNRTKMTGIAMDEEEKEPGLVRGKRIGRKS